MAEFVNVSIILPTLNETFSVIQTVQIILEECDHRDLCEFIAVVCERTLPESIEAVNAAKTMAEREGVSFRVISQVKPYAGGAVQDGIMAAQGSHVLMMSTDLETDPHTVKAFIETEKSYPNDIVTASRWIRKGSFEGYNKLKYILNFLFQKIFAVFYGVKLTDITFGFRIAPTDLFQSIAWEELKHPFFLETALKPIRLGVKIHEIPSNWVARKEGESQNTLLQTFAYLRIAFKARFERKEDMVKRV